MRIRTAEERCENLTRFGDVCGEAAAAGNQPRILELVQATEAHADDHGVIDLRLPISQEELAQWAGLSREGAVRGLSELRSAGVLETARKRVIIHDLPALEREARRSS